MSSCPYYFVAHQPLSVRNMTGSLFVLIQVTCETLNFLQGGSEVRVSSKNGILLMLEDYKYGT